jgi:dihydroneopterin aldolase
MTTPVPTQTGEPADEILLEGMRFYGFHGVNEQERDLGQRFIVDVALAVDLRRPGESDDLTDTVSYSDVYKLVRRIVEGEPRHLIEAVAERIAAAILSDFPAVVRATVTVRKPEAPLRGAILDAAGVRLTRRRDERSESG